MKKENSVSAETRWYAELAGTFLLWVEEVPDANPPWKGSILRRYQAGVTLGSYGERTSFVARTADIAMEAAETTISNSSNFAHRLGELKWQGCSVSDAEWNARCSQFLHTGVVEPVGFPISLDNPTLAEIVKTAHWTTAHGHTIKVTDDEYVSALLEAAHRMKHPALCGPWGPYPK